MFHRIAIRKMICVTGVSEVVTHFNQHETSTLFLNAYYFNGVKKTTNHIKKKN
jgi:hypothetical protein